MVDKECNLRAGVYKVQTFGTLQRDRNCRRRVQEVEPISLIDEIKKKISNRDYHLTFHARARMFERHISKRLRSSVPCSCGLLRGSPADNHSILA